MRFFVLVNKLAGDEKEAAMGQTHAPSDLSAGVRMEPKEAMHGLATTYPVLHQAEHYTLSCLLSH